MGAAATTVSASFDINRQNWGIAYPGKSDDLIKDDVQIRLNLVLGNDPIPAQDEGGAEEKTEADLPVPADGVKAPATQGDAADK